MNPGLARHSLFHTNLKRSMSQSIDVISSVSKDASVLQLPMNTSSSNGLLDRLLNWKRRLFGFASNPGSFETLHREAKFVSPSNLLFDGAKTELAKGLSPNFQVSHSIQMGSAMQPSSYSFGAIFVQGHQLMHALLDPSGNLQGKYMWSNVSLTAPRHASAAEEEEGSSNRSSDAAPHAASQSTEPGTIKTQAQIQLSSKPGQSMVQFEGDYAGTDYSINAKAINPDASQAGSGIYTANILQAISPAAAVGFELIGQKTGRFDPVEGGFNIALRLAPPKGSWIAAITLQQLAAVHASYFHRVSNNVELGTELQSLFVGPRRDTQASVAAKFDYRQATVRTQIDTLGRVAMHYEERLFPGFSLLLSGELDHVRGASRFGFGVSLEN